MRVSIARLRDLPAIYDIELKCYEFPLEHDVLRDLFESPGVIPCVLSVNSRIVSWGYCICYADNEEVHVNRLATLPAFRRKGYATRILSLMWNESYKYHPKRMKIVVPEYQMDIHDPDSVSDFLWKAGFKAVGTYRGGFERYGRRYDGIIMTRSF